jgi:hypothetical protein
LNPIVLESSDATMITGNATNINLQRANPNDPILEEERLDLEQLGKPLWIVDLSVGRPGLVILFGAMIIVSFTVVALYFETYLPSPVTNRDYLVYDDRNTLLLDARIAAEAEIQ